MKKIRKILTIIFVFTLFACGVMGVPSIEEEALAQSGGTYYVSSSGNNTNDGSLNNPWQTLAFALSRLAPGDVLNLRGGIYYENQIEVRLQGTAQAPITIQSYPGEQAIIDGGLPYFRNVPNTEWEVVNSDIGLYRSIRSFEAESFIRAWLVEDDIQLVEYETPANLEATNYGPVNGLNSLYMGPGVLLHSDNRIYIRLQYNPNDLTNSADQPISPTPTDTNPNNNSLAVFASENILMLNGSAYLHFKDLEFAHSKRIIEADTGSHHIELNECRMNYGTYGLVAYNGIHDWEISNCEFDNGLPDYVYWTDVKNRDVEVVEAYPEFQSAAITGVALPGFNIHHNLFERGFDGLHLLDGTQNVSVTDNFFIFMRDDGMELSRAISNVEIAHNLFWRVGAGISNDASDGTPGHIYIHHNIIDNSAFQRGGRPGNFRADQWPVWQVLSPFESHNDGNFASWWKLYNNTVITRRGGHQWDAAGPTFVVGNDQKYVYNNIFYVLDDRIIYRDEQAASGSHYDGNVLYQSLQTRFPFFYNFGDDKEYPSLSSFQQSSGTNWEVHGLQLDPGFNLAAIQNPQFDPATMWSRYRPSHPQVFTSGASYTGLNWPGTQDVDYRGAIPFLIPEQIAAPNDEE